MVDWNMAINASKQWSRGLVLLQMLGPKPGGAVAARHFLAGSNGFNYNKKVVFMGVCMRLFTAKLGFFQDLVEIQSTNPALQEI